MIDNATVDKLAELAKLQFDEKGKEAIKGDLEKMLKFIEKLQEVDTTGVEPMIYVNEETNVFRKDEIVPSITKKEALENAPNADSDYFKVPKVITQT